MNKFLALLALVFLPGLAVAQPSIAPGCSLAGCTYVGPITVPGLSIAAPFPSTFGSTPTNLAGVNVGSYPVGAEMPAGVPQAFVSRLVVPNGFAEHPWPAAAVSAYTLSANTAVGATSIAYFGYSGQTHANVNPYGLNVVVSNCAIVACATNTGFNGNWLGIEADINIVKTGGATPTGIARAFYAAGGSEVVPTAGATAFEVNTFGPSLSWSNGLLFDDGATSIAVNIGATGTGNGVASQPIYLQSRSSGGTANTTAIFADQNGNLTMTSPAGTGFITPVRQTIGTSTGGASIFNMDGSAGYSKQQIFLTGGIQRWLMGVSNGAETGSDAGSDFIIYNASDAGSLKTKVVDIDRASGLFTLAKGLSVGGAATTFSSGLHSFGTSSSVPVHLATAQTTAPAPTSCGTGSPVVVGTDTAGQATMGTSATGCVITFNVAYTTAPYCTVTWLATPLASQSYAVSNTAITLTQTSTSGNKAVYHCIAPSGG